MSGWFFARNWIYLGIPISSGANPRWWQAPGYHVPSDLASFGEALHHPVYSAMMGFGDGIYSTFWLDVFLRGVATATGGAPWNQEFMLSMALLSLPLTLAGFVGVPLAFRSPTRPVRLFALGCVGFFLAALLGRFLISPFISTFKSTFTLGLIPCYAVLLTSSFEKLLRTTTTRVLVSGYLFTWLAFGYVAYFA